MAKDATRLFTPAELQIYSLISRSSGIKAREIARELGLEKTEISRWMVSSALMRELCYQDKEYN